MKTRWLVGYFAILMIWAVAAALYDGRSIGSIVFSVSVLGLLGAAMILSGSIDAIKKPSTPSPTSALPCGSGPRCL
jgi:hypothetical protein